MKRPGSIAERLLLLESQLDGLLEKQAPSANMDAGRAGATLKGAYLGPAISQALHEALWEAGYLSLAQIRAATDEQLLQVSGIGKGTLHKIRLAVD